MDRIVLTSKPEWPAAPGTFAVVGQGCTPPAGVTMLDIDDLCRDPERLTQGGTMLVIGLSRLLKPSNRVRYGQVLLRPYRGLRRVSIDDRLFVSEPWRLWWHFFATRTRYDGDFTDSFRAESTWWQAHEAQTPDPFSLDTVLRCGRGHIRVEPDAFRFGPYEERTVDVGPDVQKAYDTLKARLFKHCSSVKGVIAKLGRFAQENCPDRSIPARHVLCRSESGAPVEVVRSSLKIDEYLIGRIRNVVELTNGIATWL